MVSTETYSRWAGPIIDVLLDYVGDVKLCSRLMEHLDSYPDWAEIKEKASRAQTSSFTALLLLRKRAKNILMSMRYSVQEVKITNQISEKTHFKQNVWVFGQLILQAAETLLL